VAARDGHLYSDKAPGAALLAVPAVAAAARLLPPARARLDVLAWVGTVFAVGLPFAGALGLLVGALRRLGASEGGALFAAASCGLATPLWAYATLLWGHALAAAGLVAAFAAAVALADGGPHRRALLLGVGVGLAAGWAVVTEAQAAPAAVLLALLALERARAGRAPLLPAAAGVVAGALACAAVLGLYDRAAFGSPLALGYRHVVGWTGMQQGVLGVGAPRLDVLLELLVRPFRGLLPLAPALALAPLGLARWLARPGTRAPAAVAVAIAGYYLLLNAGYVYWDGGWTYGPRLLAPGVPFLCLGLAPLWTGARAWLRGAALALALAGFVQALGAVAVTPQISSAVRRPVTGLVLPALLAGRVAIGTQSIDDLYPAPPGRPPPSGSWNLGLALGLPGVASLLPLVALLAAAAAVIVRGLGRPDRSAAGGAAAGPDPSHPAVPP
jgi:hypothetical protein